MFQRHNKEEAEDPSKQLPQPALKYPPLAIQPNPLVGGQANEYMVNCASNFVQTMKTLPYYIQPESSVIDIKRYSDKYKVICSSDNVIEWKPDWNRLPLELNLKSRKEILSKIRTKSSIDYDKVLENMTEDETLKDTLASEEDTEEEEADNTIEDEEEVNDYTTEYFDNGEKNDDEDDNLESESL